MNGHAPWAIPLPLILPSRSRPVFVLRPIERVRCHPGRGHTPQSPRVQPDQGRKRHPIAQRGAFKVNEELTGQPTAVLFRGFAIV